MQPGVTRDGDVLSVVPHQTKCAGGVNGDCGLEVPWPRFLGTHGARAAGSSALLDQPLLQADEEGAPHSWYWD